MPKRLRDNPLNQDPAKRKKFHDSYLRRFFERTTVEQNSTPRISASREPVKPREEFIDSTYLPAEAYASTDALYVEYPDDSDDEDSGDLF